MQAEPALMITFGIALAIVLIGFVLRFLNQPHVITYIIVGVVVGPSVFALVSDPSAIVSLGSIGLVLLMFFVGMEISLPRLVSNWKVAVIGTALQIFLSISLMLFFGKILGWTIGKSVLFAFVISLSSTAVIVKILKDWKELHTQTGQNVLGILLVQDIAIVPMLISLNVLSSEGGANIGRILYESAIGVLIVLFIFYIIRKERIKFPFEDEIKKDPELFIFLSFIICFGFAILASTFGLSSAFGAFLAGLLVSEGENNFHIKRTLEPFYLLFVAIFFVSIGILLDLDFAFKNLNIILALTLFVFVLNTVINMFILKFLGSNWKESFYAGAMLSQLGEFGFILAATGLSIGVLTQTDNALIIAIISLTLILSPFWIKLVKTLVRIEKGYLMKIPEKLTIAKIHDIYPDMEDFKNFYAKLKRKP